MTTKNFLAVLASALTIVLIACLIFVSYQMYMMTRPISSISVSRTENRKVDVEKAILRVYFGYSGSNILDLNNKINQKMQEVEKYLAQQSIPESKIKTNRTAFTEYLDSRTPLSPSDSRSNQRVESSLEIEFDDIKQNKDKPATVFDGLVKFEPVRFDNWDYKFGTDSQELCREIGKQALEKAVNEARSKIKILNGSEVSTEATSNESACAQEFGYVRPMPAASMARDGEISSTPTTRFSPGQIEISVTVDLKMNYRLTNLW